MARIKSLGTMFMIKLLRNTLVIYIHKMSDINKSGTNIVKYNIVKLIKELTNTCKLFIKYIHENGASKIV